ASKGIAAYISQNGYLVLCQYIEHSPVWAARAHNGRSYRHRCVGSYALRLGNAERRAYHSLIEFAYRREELLAYALNAKRSHMVLYDSVKLLYDVELTDSAGKLPYQVLGERVDYPELEHRNAVAEHLFYILVA